MARTVPVAREKVVIITSNDGGYLGGKCVACGEGGYLESRHGFPYQESAQPSNRLRHTKDCPMNRELSEDGSFKK